MNTQEQLLNPSYSLRQSNLSMGKNQPQPQSNLYATSQVNVYPGKSQQYYVTSTLPTQQTVNPTPLQAYPANRLNTINNYSQFHYPSYPIKQSQNAQVFHQRKQTQSRISYHPYTRTYIDYEERVVLVPVERVRINYYEKIYETEYVPQAVEEIVAETVPVEKEVLNVQYIPVEQKIVHFPKEKEGVLGNERTKKIIYYNAKGQEITQQEYFSVFKQQNTVVYTNPTIITQKSNSDIRFVGVPTTVETKINKENKSEVIYKEVSNVSQESQRDGEQQQIILNDKKSESSKKLGQSHVKEVYKPSYSPINQSQGHF